MKYTKLSDIYYICCACAITLLDIQLTCKICNGERFKKDILKVYFQDKNISDVEVLKEVLKERDLDVESIMEIVLSQDCKDKLIKNTDDAVNKGCFGVPTFFYDNQIFFGKDHLHQLEQYINSNK